MDRARPGSRQGHEGRVTTATPDWAPPTGAKARRPSGRSSGLRADGGVKVLGTVSGWRSHLSLRRFYVAMLGRSASRERGLTTAGLASGCDSESDRQRWETV